MCWFLKDSHRKYNIGCTMGTGQSARRESFDANGDVCFDHFQILRAIGKGSFGKVCVVQKKDTKTMFAMKYMNKAVCAEKCALRNVIREVALLRNLEHTFIVNLWFTFEDEEDMFMVVDLLLGGDLRYHIMQNVVFCEQQVKLYICEIALALDYLSSKLVIHRDIKPDNLLLDEEGHIHLTDFNVATQLKEEGKLAKSLSGTKPYMAPEIFSAVLDECPGYSYAVDWWALGVCAYEIFRGKRPYDIVMESSLRETKQLLLSNYVNYPISWSDSLRNLLDKLFTVNPAKRLCSLRDLKAHYCMSDIDFDKVLRRQVKAVFIPAKDHLNCDPMYELEEMIIEAKPLHKKKKRLAQQNSKKDKQHLNTAMDNHKENLSEFKCYNREKELETRKILAAQATNEQLDNPSDDNKSNEKVDDNTSIKGNVKVTNQMSVQTKDNVCKDGTCCDSKLTKVQT